jgi:hypothetical protein
VIVYNPGVMTRSLALFALLLAALSAQNPVGRITGTVSDSTGAAIPDVAITVTNVATAESYSATTNISGVFVVSPLPLGDFRLEMKKNGFRAVTRSGIRIDVNSTLTLDQQLDVGNVTESITVQDSAALIQTENQAIGNSRYEAQLKNLPVLVREVQTLIAQTAGVPRGSRETVAGTIRQGNRSAMQVISDGAQVNPFQTTGWPAIDGIGRRADLSLPSMDAIAEVKSVTSGASAEYIQPAQVIVASKTGTNALHGSLFEFYRSGGMGARRWEAPTRDTFVRHQFGGTVGGRIIKDKLFYFGGVDSFRHTQGSVLNARYPTDNERSGNLASMLQRRDAQGRPAAVTVFDPLTREPFAGNVIPASRISPVSRELLRLIPGGAPLPADLTSFNAVLAKPLYDNSDKYDIRTDWNISANDRMFFKTTFAYLNQASRIAGFIPGGDNGYATKRQWNQTIGVNYTRTINPSTIGVMQFTYRSLPFRNIPTAEGNQKFPVPIRDLDPEAGFQGPPAINLGSNALAISNIWDRPTLNYSDDYNWAIDPNLTKILGNHTLKTGFTMLSGTKTTRFASPPWGRFSTSSDFNNVRSTSSATGDSFADFLLGMPSSTDVTIGQAGGTQLKTNFGFFFQDDWKITRKLTLNLGARYDNLGLFEERDGLASAADFATGKILIPNGTTSKIHPAYRPFADRFLEVNQAGVPNTFIKPNNRDFSPRIGAAYRVASDFVIRGGFGLYFVDYTVNEFRAAVNAPPFIRRAQLTRAVLIAQNVDVNNIFTFANPTANSSAAGADAQLTTLEGFNPDYPTQRTWQWNLTVEKTLFRDYGLRASYVGNVGRNMARQVRVNSCVAGPVECLNRPANDPTGRRWQQFNNNVGRHWNDGESNYNAGEIEITRRFSRGILISANYTWSKLLAYDDEASDPVGNRMSKYDYGPALEMPRHLLHWNFVSEIPFGKGRAFGSNMSRVAEAVLGGWQLSGLGSWQSGQFLNATATGQSPTGAVTNRADRVADGRLNHDGQTRGQAALQWFDVAAFRLPAFVNPTATRPTRQFGTAGYGVVVGPSYFQFDGTIEKAFAITETMRLKFRGEVFNPFNVPMLDQPGLVVGSGDFGRIRTSNPEYQPRSIQFGMRLDF